MSRGKRPSPAPAKPPRPAPAPAPAPAQAGRLFVDAIEGGRARLLLGGDAFTIPASLLPPGAVEGSWLRLSFQLTAAPPEEAEAEATRRRLGADDDGGDLKL